MDLMGREDHVLASERHRWQLRPLRHSDHINEHPGYPKSWTSLLLGGPLNTIKTGVHSPDSSPGSVILLFDAISLGASEEVADEIPVEVRPLLPRVREIKHDAVEHDPPARLLLAPLAINALDKFNLLRQRFLQASRVD